MPQPHTVDRRLPVPVAAYGALMPAPRLVHELAHTGHCHEAIAAADAFIAIARATGDERTVSYLLQGKMYANLMIGRHAEASVLGEELLRRHESAGFPLGAAKTLSDLAELHVLGGRFGDAMRCLARASLILDEVPPGGDRYRSAMASFAAAATTAEMYEVAADAYRRLGVGQSFTSLSMATPFELSCAITLLSWGLRLDHLGQHSEATIRLRQCVSLAERWVDGFTSQRTSRADLGTVAVLAVALAKLGRVVEAEDLARGAVLPLRTAESFWQARLAHLALGISLRTQGRLLDAQREFVAAQQLCDVDARPDEVGIIRFELAMVAVALDGGPSSRMLFETVEAQTRDLWLLRRQRLAMLRQARQREQIQSARRRAERDMVLDPLTGLGNRRRFDRAMAEIDHGILGPPLLLLVIDVDHFKAVNDRHSHSTGDAALREIAGALRDTCRSDDLATRYAGDEFAVFLRTDPATGWEIAERMRAAVAAIHLMPGLQLSISVGMAAWRDGMTSADLFQAADERLYEAKHRGRNAVAG